LIFEKQQREILSILSEVDDYDKVDVAFNVLHKLLKFGKVLKSTDACHDMTMHLYRWNKLLEEELTNTYSRLHSLEIGQDGLHDEEFRSRDFD
jgi:hypothetical protein